MSAIKTYTLKPPVQHPFVTTNTKRNSKILSSKTQVTPKFSHACSLFLWAVLNYLLIQITEMFICFAFFSFYHKNKTWQKKPTRILFCHQNHTQDILLVINSYNWMSAIMFTFFLKHCTVYSTNLPEQRVNAQRHPEHRSGGASVETSLLDQQILLKAVSAYCTTCKTGFIHI